MKKNNIKVVPCIIGIMLFTTLGFHNMKDYYDAILSTTGLSGVDFEKELIDENERAKSNNEEFKQLLDSSDIDDLPEGGVLEGQENSSSLENAKEETPATATQEDLELHAKASLLMDADNNRVLYEESGYKKMAMASTTKIMTCIVALENADLDGVVPVSSYAASMPDVQLNIKKGEEYYLKDLLFSLMLESHNDTAVAIAEYVGGSVEGFATMMNDKARTLGCEATNFITPNGLDAEGHYTTARDLAVIASYAIKNEKFIAITNTASHTFQEVHNKRGFTVTNKNKFLYLMDGAIGVKTGFTGDAGYCFVGAIKRNDKTLISVVLGCGWPPNKNLKWRDTEDLMSYGLDNYKKKQIFEAVELQPVFVENGQQKYEKLELTGDLQLLLRDDEKVKVIYDIPKTLTAPVKANSIVGRASYYIGDVLYDEIPIYAKEDVLKIDFKFCLNEIMKLWSQRY